MLDELTLAISPMLLGEGERLFDGSIRPQLELVEHEQSALASQLRFKVG